MNSELRVNLIAWTLLVILGASMAGLIYMIHDAFPNQATYNCSLSEISPDFTPKMREECRKLRAQK